MQLCLLLSKDFGASHDCSFHCCRGGIRTMMITGDYHHTAIAVAKDVGMLSDSHEVIIIDAKPSQAPNAMHMQRTAHDNQLPESAQQRQSFESDDSAQQRQLFESAQTATTAGSASDYELPSDQLLASSSSVLPNTVSSANKASAAHVTTVEGPGQPSSSASMTKALTHVPTPLMTADGPRQPSSSASVINPLSHMPAHVTLAHECQGLGMHSRHDTLSCLPLPSPASHKVSFDLLRSTSHAPSYVSQGPLTFVRGLGGAALGRVEALTALTSGQTQCAVTGDAFQQMLQASDLSVLECVMRNSVVFARMKPHQKGQVMDLWQVTLLYALC